MVTNGNLSQNGNVTRYSTAQLAMDGVYSWIINSPDSTMVSKLINCAYSYDTISGELNGGIFLLIGFRSGGYAHITAHSYWNNRAISVAIIENGVWTKRFDKILTNTDLHKVTYKKNFGGFSANSMREFLIAVINKVLENNLWTSSEDVIVFYATWFGHSYGMGILASQNGNNDIIISYDSEDGNSYTMHYVPSTNTVKTFYKRQGTSLL